MTEQKKFKVVFVKELNMYEIWSTDYTGEMDFSVSYATFTKEGELIHSPCDDAAFISEDILWEFNKLVNLGYEFVGIERK